MRLVACSILSALLALCVTMPNVSTQSVRADSKESSSPEDRTYLLKYEFEPNHFVHYHVVHKVTVTTLKGTQKDIAFNQTKTRKHYRVVYVDEEGNGTLEPVIDRVQMQIRFGENDVRFWDSQLQKEPIGPFKQVARTIGKPLIRLKATPHGKPISITSLSSKPIQPGRKNTEKHQGQNILALLPEKPVRIGETWRERYEVSIPLGKTLMRKIRMLRQYTLKSVEKNQATISTKTAVITPIAALETRLQLILQQAQTSGTIVFDLDRGIVVSREIKSDERVIGVYGPDSSLHSLSVLTEQFVPSDSVAKKSDETSSQ